MSGKTGSLIVFAVALLASPGLALDEVGPVAFDGPNDSEFRITASNRIRGEFVDWWKTDPSGPSPNSSYNFMGNRFQLGVGFQMEWLEIFAQFQHTLLAALPAPGGPGPGGVYYANTPRRFQESPILRHAWARIEGWGALEDFSVMGGRMPYLDGMQAPASNPALLALQRSRIGQRLIGPFEYTMVGRSFDGGKVSWQNDKLNATFFGFIPTQGGFEINGNPQISEINVGGASLNLRDSKVTPNTIGRFFWFWYNDDRDIVVLDNRPAPERQATAGEKIGISTIGANVVHIEPLGPGRADVLAWGVGQWGEWQDLNHTAWAFTAEAGYALPDVWGSPWLRAGFTSGSGDSDPNDGTHGTFFEMLPTARIYALTPLYNMMNNKDAFLEFLLQPHATVALRSDFHWLRVNSTSDFAYFGGGATSDTFFGYGGVPADGRTDLAYLLDFSVTWTPTRNVMVYGYYGHGFGQGIANTNFLTKDLNYGYIELTLSL